MPVTGDWKTVVSLQRGSEVMAAPVYLPADPSIGAEAVPLVPERSGPFVRNTTLLLREQHPGPQWPAVAVWVGFVTALAVWIGLMAVTAMRVRGGRRGRVRGCRRGRSDHRLVDRRGIGRSLAPHGR